MKYLFKFLIIPLILLPFFIINKMIQLYLVIVLILWNFNFKKEWLKEYMKPWFIFYLFGMIDSNTFRGMWNKDNNIVFMSCDGNPPLY